MSEGAWKDLFQAHLDGGEAERAALYETLAEEAALDPKVLDEFVAMRELNFLLSSEFSPSAADDVFVSGVCGVLEKSRKPSTDFVLEVVNKNEKRRTTAILMRKKQRFQWSAVAAVFLLGVAAIWIFVSRSSSQPASNLAVREALPVGHIVLLDRAGVNGGAGATGAVTISRKVKNEQKDVAARTGDTLYREDVLVTKPATDSVAQAELVLKDIGTVQMFPATKVDVLAPDADEMLRLESGRLMVNVATLPVPKTFAIRTPHAIATVLGTRFGLVTTATETRLEVYESKVRMQLLKPDGTAVPVGGTATSSAVVEAGFSAVTSRDALTIAALPREQYVAEIQEGLNGYAWTQDGAISTQLADRTQGNGLTLFEDPEVLVTKLTQRNYEKRVLLRFDGLTLPKNARLESAELELRFENFNGDQKVKGVYMRAEWNPGAKGATGLGWLYRDINVRWSEAGTGPGDYVAGKTFELSGFKDGYEVLQKIVLDVEQVRSWIEQPTTNQGVLLIAQDVDKPLRMMTSRNPKAMLRPLLRLRYSAPAGSVPGDAQKNPVKVQQRETF